MGEPALTSRNAVNLVGLLRLVLLLFALEAIVDGLASGKAVFHGVPEVDTVLAKFPAEQHDLAVDFAGKIEQACVEIFNLNANGIDLGDGVLRGLKMRFKRGTLTAHAGDVNEEPAGEKYLAGQI